MRRIIVTGAAGLIGSAVVWALNRRGEDRVLAVDNLERDDRWMNLRALRFQNYMQRNEFLDLVERSDLLRDVHAVIHLGACSDTTERDADYLVRNNFQFSQRLALHCLAEGVRFIYASSAATYGDGAQGYADDEAGLDHLRPLNMYGYSKHLFDQWARREGILPRLAGLKYFNVFGPNEYHKGDMRSMVLKAYQQACDTGRIRLFRSHRPDFADGEQKRDFLYVKDAAAMTLHFLDHPELGGIFNIGAGTARSWNELATAVARAMDRPVEIEYFDMPEVLRDRYQYFTQADMAKFRDTGWTGRTTPLEEAVEDYVRRYLVPGAFLDPSDGQQ